MIYSNDNFLNNVDQTSNLLEYEKNFIVSSIEIQNTMKNMILNYMKNFAYSDESININSVTTIYTFLENLKNSLELCNENILNLDTLVHKLDAIINEIKNGNVNLDDTLRSFNSDYSDIYTDLYKNTLKIQDCLVLISKQSEFRFDISEVQENDIESQTTEEVALQPDTSDEIEEVALQPDTSDEIEEVVLQPNTSDEIEEVALQPDTSNEIEEVALQPDTSNEIAESEAISEKQETNDSKETSVPLEYEEDTLIVSESSGKVILPYQMSKVKMIYENNTDLYSSINDVIQKKYTVPITNYKNSTISRFKEGFKLMRKKEKASITEAFELGLELMFNYNLHPAIISACKNLDELDVYLDYLESGETNKFKCFKVIFDIAPNVTKLKGNEP